MAAEEDDFRVETRLGNASRGMNTTPEYIEELRDRLKRQMQLTQAKPKKSFGAVLADSTASPEPEAASVAAETPAPPEQKPTPRPGLRHPGEKTAYGVLRKTSVVLKG